MAYTTGVAANYKDLLSIMATFASTNGWTILHQNEAELYMRGEGSSGLDKIYVGAQAFENVTEGYYNWELLGSVFFNPKLSILDQPRQTGYKVYAHWWNDQIPYWMFITPRRIILVGKVSTNYIHVYLGFINPLGTASQYPYPLLIGGVSNDREVAYSNTSKSTYWNDKDYVVGCLYLPGGFPGHVGSYDYENWRYPSVRCNPLYTAVEDKMLTSPDGSYLLEPFYYVSRRHNDVFGSLDGVYKVTGYQNASENIITVSGLNYMVFQDTFRSNYDDFCAIRMD